MAVAKAIALPPFSSLPWWSAPENGLHRLKQDRDSESSRISVDVALVVLPATVIDRQGALSPIWRAEL